jgi:dTDP-4-amino-4,6-dideoxygalactose transaminase
MRKKALIGNKPVIPVAKPFLGEEEAAAVREVILSGWVTQGPKVQEFERIFAEYVGAKYAVAVTSCTTALQATLSVLGIGRGDEVIVPSLSFIATANTVVHTRAKPVFIDINPETCNVDFNNIEEAITERSKAIMPVHQMGLPVDLDAVNLIAKKNKLHFIEDAACAIGSMYKGKMIGGHGNIACFSFHPRKLITTGEGGMITTDDPEIDKKLRSFRHHGMSVSDIERHKSQRVIIENYIEVGFNYRMTDIQAAIGIVQMKKLPEILVKRTDIAKAYNEAFSKIDCLRVPKTPEYAMHNYQSYWLEILQNSPLNRDQLMQSLLDRGIASRRGIMAIHKEPCYSDYYNMTLPNTERITSNTIILPLYPSMTDEEVKYVIDEIFDILR